MIRTVILSSGLFAALTLALVGCSQAPPAAGTGGTAAHKDGDHKDAKGGGHNDGEAHGHKPGAHGGTIVSLGQDSYHAEAVFGKDGTVRLYLLGKDEVKPQEADAQELVAHVTPAGSTDAVPVKFAAERQTADAAGKTSLFVAKLPPDLHGKNLKVVVNNLQVGSERFRIEFSNATNDKGGHGH